VLKEKIIHTICDKNRNSFYYQSHKGNNMLFFRDKIKRSKSDGKESKKREVGKGGRYAKPFDARVAAK